MLLFSLSSSNTFKGIALTFLMQDTASGFRRTSSSARLPRRTASTAHGFRRMASVARLPAHGFRRTASGARLPPAVAKSSAAGVARLPAHGRHLATGARLPARGSGGPAAARARLLPSRFRPAGQGVGVATNKARFSCFRFVLIHYEKKKSRIEN